MKNYFERFVNNLDQNKLVQDSNSVSDTTLTSEKKRISPDNNDNSYKSKENISASLAIYDNLRTSPRIIRLNAQDYEEFIDLLAIKTYHASKEVGGNMPYTVIREIIENLIHAYFKEVVISILDNGNTVRISDQCPGIKNKEKAFEPGFSTATSDMKKIIKGVGSGLPITKETLMFLGGAITIEDNLNQGTVITLRVPSEKSRQDFYDGFEKDNQSFNLNKRQKQILFLIMELGSAGPSTIAKELGISLATAHRDLVYLEEQSLIHSNEQGKRVLTSIGIDYLDKILNQ